MSYPISHIENIVRPVSAAPAAKNVIFLSADAFGVLPPVSILTPEQAQYYFLSGFTAKLAGTERGITEPTPTFSACFGQAFLELHPTKYGEELVKKMEQNGAKAYLVNTGWNGTGKRITIKDTRGIIDAILDGSILTPEQTKYYFLSGFTAKLAGTERGITEPTPTFSACFGQAFLELHPTKYAEELVKKMEKSGAKAYLVNTGWNGTGKRISIKDTRGIIDAILSGAIASAPTKKIPHFDFEVPTELPGVDSGILDPRDTYADASEWEKKAQDLASRFVKNFVKYEGNEAGKALVAAGPKA